MSGAYWCSDPAGAGSGKEGGIGRNNADRVESGRTEQKLDGSGRPKGESVKVFEVYPGLPGEDRYRRMIEEDGKPVPQSKLALKDRELVPQAQNLDLLLAHVHRRQTYEGEGVRHDKIGQAQQHG